MVSAPNDMSIKGGGVADAALPSLLLFNNPAGLFVTRSFEPYNATGRCKAASAV